MAPRTTGSALVLSTALAALAAAATSRTPNVVQLRLSRRSLLVEEDQSAHNGSSLTWAHERALRAAALATDADMQRRRRRRLQAAVSIYGDYRELAYYYADVFVGSPTPQRFSVITDTGSSIMSVPCKGCATCGRHQNPPYDPAASASAAKLQCADATICSSCAPDGGCEYVQSYAEGSALRGVIYRDLVFLGDDSDVPPGGGGGGASPTPSPSPSTGGGAAARRLSAASIYNRGRRAQHAEAAGDEPSATPAASTGSGAADSGNSSAPPLPPPREPHSSFAVPYDVGCGRYESGLFVSQLADGILGIGPSDRTLFAALWRQGALRRQMFSLCLSWVGGALTVGDVDTALHTGAVQWAALSVSGYYGVGLTGLVAGEAGDAAVAAAAAAAAAGPAGAPSGDGSAIAIDVSSFLPSNTRGGGAGRTTIVDSGTTFTYLPRAVYRPFVAALAAYCERPGRCVGRRVPVSGEELCYRVARPADLATFPSVTITLAPANALLDPPVVLTAPPQSVFVSMGWHRGAYCLAYHDNGAGRDVGAVLGANTLLGHDVIIDRTERLVGPQRVGFAPAHCSLDGARGDGSDGNGSADGGGGVWVWWVDWWGGEDADTVVAGVPDATVAAGAVVGALLATCLCCVCASYCCGCRCCGCCRRSDGEWVCRLGKVVSITVAPASSSSTAAAAAGSASAPQGSRGGRAGGRPVIVPKVRLFDATHRPRPDLARVIAGAAAPRLAVTAPAGAPTAATNAAAAAPAPPPTAPHADDGADDERDDEGAALTGAPAAAAAAAAGDGPGSPAAAAVRIELPHPADAMAALRRGAAAAAAGVAGAGRGGRRYQQLQRAGSSDASSGEGGEDAPAADAATEGAGLVRPAGADEGAAQPHR